MDNWKCMCDDCGWNGENADLLTAASPFDESEVIRGCPRCKSIDQFTRCCDEPDCWWPVSCGTPTESGYRSTCSHHKPQ